MAKRKRTNNDLQSTTQKTKDRETWNPLKTGGVLWCSQRVSMFCSSSYTRRCQHVYNTRFVYDNACFLCLFLGFTYLGCIYDNKLRVLPYEKLILKKRMTTENCIDHCLSFNIYDYAGTEVSCKSNYLTFTIIKASAPCLY